MPYTPVPTKRRITLIDALRGLAIFGILMVNLPLMYQPMTYVMFNPGLGTEPLNVASTWLIKVFFEGKFYILFSALFGYGFYLFVHKPSGDPTGHLKRFRRRLFVLLLIGLAHILFLWAGDILLVYALFGFLLLAFRKSTVRRQAIWAAIFILLPVVMAIFSFLMIQGASSIPEAAVQMEVAMAENLSYLKGVYESAAAAYSEGTYRDTIIWRWREYLTLLPAILFFYPTVLGMFLLGYIAARKELISNYTAHLHFWRKARNLGWIIGLPLSILYAYSMHQAPPGDQASGWYALGTTVHVLGGILLCMGYVGSIVCHYAANGSRLFDAYLAPVGRMALTNYILHSALAVVIFHGVGFGLFGKIETWQSVLLATAIFTAQVFASRWWLARFRFGPLEWLWRSLTYGKLQPMSY